MWACEAQGYKLSTLNNALPCAIFCAGMPFIRGACKRWPDVSSPAHASQSDSCSAAAGRMRMTLHAKGSQDA